MKQTINCVLTFDDEGLFTKTNKIPQLSQKRTTFKKLTTIQNHREILSI